MLIIPAIDIKEGKCVRLTRGDFSQKKIYLDNPADMAIIWRKQNAKMLHIVDLDAALTGETVNFEKIKEIVATIDIPVQVGGGIRSVDAVKKYLDIGVSRVVIGSAAVTNPQLIEELMKLYRPSKIVVGIDAATNTVIAGKKEALLQTRVVAQNFSLPSDFKEGTYGIKVRYRSPQAKAHVKVENETIIAELEEGVYGLASGQALVIYQGDVVLGGGWIEA